MSKSTDTDQAANVLDQEDSLKRMIFFTKREAEKDGRTFCAYLLDLALNALNEDNPEMNQALRAKITPLSMDLKTSAQSNDEVAAHS
ncbi:hypothetical protein [Roseibium algae]|uniref:Uncharacterized protein n=1 Tax=Roseibium algae TaxID=3123038 RepID=A0ABU8TKP7_9HYPH